MGDAEKKVNIVMQSGYALIIDLLSQAINLAVTFSKESEHCGIDGITTRALKTSIIMLIFNSLEGFCNFISQLIVQICDHETIAGSIITQTETDFLLEQETYLDTRTGRLKLRSNNYSSIIDKITLIPLIFARIHGEEFRLDKSNENWRQLIQFKLIRDGITHIKFDVSKVPDAISINNINEMAPYFKIDNKELFFGINSVREYFFTVNAIVSKFYPSQKLVVGVIDILYWMILMNLRIPCNISEQEIVTLRVPPVSQEEKHDIA